MSAIAEKRFLQINSCSFARGEIIREFYVWLSNAGGLGELLFFSGSRSEAIDFANTISDRHGVLVIDRTQNGRAG
jgi:hypothetical protein